MASLKRQTSKKNPARKPARNRAGKPALKSARTPARKSARKPAAAKVPSASASIEPDEFSASGGFPALAPGRDRSGERPAVRELSWADFDRLVQKLAMSAKVFKPEAVVGLVHGGVFVGGAMASALKADFFPVRVTRRSRDHHAGGAVSDELPEELEGRRVLIVDDVAASGDSLEFALRGAKARGVRKLATASLVSRPGRYKPDFSALESDELFVFPWDYAPLVNDGRFDPKAAPKVAAKVAAKVVSSRRRSSSPR